MWLNNSYNVDVKQAYIISLAGNQISQEMTARCHKSCTDVGMESAVWEAYDGTGEEIKKPTSHVEFMDLLKVVDQHLSRTEIACALSHIRLWYECVKLDQPIVILEHDSVMIKPYYRHNAYNSIVYLGCSEQAKKGWNVMPIPPHGCNGHNYHFMLRAHAYAIDPAVAKNILAHVLKFGICESLDIMLRADIFPIQQQGIYAFEDRGETTIVHRKKQPDGSER